MSKLKYTLVVVLLVILLIVAGFYAYLFVSSRQAKEDTQAAYNQLKWARLLTKVSGQCSAIQCRYEYSTNSPRNTVSDTIMHTLSDANYQIGNNAHYNTFNNLASPYIQANLNTHNIQIKIEPSGFDVNKDSIAKRVSIIFDEESND